MRSSQYRTASLMILSLVLFACSGTVSGTGESEGATGAGGSGLGGNGGAAQGGGPASEGGQTTAPPANDDFSCDPNLVPAGRARIWRLNAVQYANTVGAFVAGTWPSSPHAQKPANIASPFGDVDRSRPFSTYAEAYGMGDQDFAQVLDASREVGELTLKALEAKQAICAGDGYAACVKQLVETRGPILFHRPLTTDEVTHYAQLAIENRARLGDRRALGLALRGLLAAPQFLFRTELGQPDGDKQALTPFELAAALSYSLTAGPPDRELWQAASTGALDVDDRTELRKQVERLLANLEGEMLDRFFREWLAYEGVVQVAKDDKAFPKHAPDLLVDDTRLFVNQLLSDHGSEGFLAALLTTDKAVVRGKTAWSYGLDLPEDAAPAFVSLPAGQRSGLLTQPSLLVAGSHTDATDPVRRGLFVRERLLCDEVPKIPIENVPPLPDLGPDATVRDRLRVHVEGNGCKSCHLLMDPIGLGLEGYDHMGRHRTEEKGKPVNVEGDLQGAGSTIDGSFEGAFELGLKLADSPRVKQCLSRQAFRFFMGRSEEDHDGCTLVGLADAFGDAEDLRALMVSLFTSDAFVFRRSTP